jgi:CDP-glycerol glycerophosphotransferase
VSAALVSVVIAVHEDVERVPRAIRSALGPGVLEVIVVDDGSGDGSAEVAEQVATEDPRVRVLRRDTRSGFPGVPRNAGIDAATGQYLLFLDSDDALEPGAVESLLAEAERTGADLVFGRTTRVNELHGTTTPWMPWLFGRTGLTTMSDRPELIGDTLHVDRLIRRTALGDLRYPTDILYEDVLFTAELALRVGVISVLDVPLYRWHVRAVDEDRSITNSRRLQSNLEHRLEANRRVQAALDRAGRDDLRLASDRKFVEHDLPLLLRDLADRPPEVRSLVLERVAAFTALLHDQVRRSAQQPGALVLAVLATGDPDEVIAAAALAYRRHLARRVVTTDARMSWPALEGPASDVTELVRPLMKGGAVLTHEVMLLTATDDRLRVRVRSRLVAGSGSAGWHGLVLVDRRRRLPVGFARGRRAEGGLREGRTWEAELSVAAGLRLAELQAELDVRVVTRGRLLPVRWALAVPEDSVAGVDLLSRGRRAAAFQTGLGNLSLRRVV